MKKYGISAWYGLLLALCLFLSMSGNASAAMSDDAVKYLKGKWWCNTITGVTTPSGETVSGPMYYVTFEKKYATYHYMDAAGNYDVKEKFKIKVVRKRDRGYLIKLKEGEYKVSYQSVRTGDGDFLEYYDTWKESEFNEHYFGTASLERY